MCMYIPYRSIIYFGKQVITMAISSSSSPYSFLFFSISILLLSSPCFSSDPDPLQDFCVGASNSTLSINGFPCKPVSQVSSADFFFDGFIKPGNTSNIFGVGSTSGNVLTFPGLNTLGISMNRLDIAPGGMNPPHSHPRSTESGVVIEGKLLVGFVSTSNVFYSKVLCPGEMFVIPRGLVHFQKNVGQEKALLFVAFNSHLPGTVAVPIAFFATQPPIPNDVLTQTFQVGEDVVNGIRSKFV